MKKKLLGTFLAAALIVSQALNVFAAGSISGQAALTDEYSSSYQITEASEETFAELAESAPDVVEKILAVNAGTESLQSLMEELAPELASQVAGKDMVTPFFDLKPINGGIKTEDGKYRVELSVPTLTESMTDVMLLHYSTVRSVWELITPEKVDYSSHQITAVFEDLSPVAVIANTKAASADSTLSGTAAGTSPKTGYANIWMLWAGAAAVLAAAGGLTWRKSRR